MHFICIKIETDLRQPIAHFIDSIKPYIKAHPAAIQRHDAIKLFIDYHLIIRIHFTCTFVRKANATIQLWLGAMQTTTALLSSQHILFVNELKIDNIS